LRVSPKRTRK